ncbi:hypothetical protein YSA_02339 [Pseudomonas putida ND6]|uniref:Uncharacterized protein n=1 Tax=Pseudomonas putida ND6 TaxID=231023 RepID=I3URB3_PSEPU|nr:hypothetical protein YSA_02339 [Pseudomonas putida ND6]
MLHADSTWRQLITHSRPSFPLPVPWSRANTAKGLR